MIDSYHVRQTCSLHDLYTIGGGYARTGRGALVYVQAGYLNGAGADRGRRGGTGSGGDGGVWVEGQTVGST